MTEPEAIMQKLCIQNSPGILQGKKILITAGPTREKLDPVRYITNRSSGKMGYALAELRVHLGCTFHIYGIDVIRSG
jgi:phosphopantothenoylcysteine decarboxylase/phosphopantothenate--cysteine ligase